MRLIDADEAIKLAEGNPEVIAVLSSTPTYKPEKGLWLEFNVGSLAIKICDTCGFLTPVTDNTDEFHFCPNCGQEKW